ncbi:CDP-glycerol glycerophosphotransferase family protein, partial [Butyrivibrio sp. AE3009]|uniref:CDP-glycerol glycerophosphotransferase family protein n=1 Tax=Butyrivibrio sp. AE3009 TaxID=1280666 RepID=UPI0003B52232
MGLGLKVKRAVFKLIRIVVRPFYGRNIWIISDRINQAGDNGEAFFKYLQDKDVKSVFAIRKDSPDYPRLRSIGKVVEYDSKLHKLLLCVADCNCSAYLIHMENHVETPQIFLQHGVSEKDISKYINPASHKNFYIITSAYQEKRQMMGDNYKVAPEHIWLTGLARFDYLRNEPKKLVVFAFTWRSAFMDYSDEEIASSEYFKTLKRIMSDSTFCEKLSLMGYKLAIMPHPKVREYVHLLPQSKSCEIYAGSYNKMYSEAELIVTDYSSAIFDFAYLRKSIIYYQ